MYEEVPTNQSGKGLAWRREASSCNAFATATFSSSWFYKANRSGHIWPWPL